MQISRNSVKHTKTNYLAPHTEIKNSTEERIDVQRNKKTGDHTKKQPKLEITVK